MRHRLTFSALVVSALVAGSRAQAQETLAARTFSQSTPYDEELFDVILGYAQTFTIDEPGNLVRVDIEASWVAPTGPGRDYLWELRAASPTGTLLASGLWSFTQDFGSGSGVLSFAVPTPSSVTDGQVVSFSLWMSGTSAVGDPRLTWHAGDPSTPNSTAGGAGHARTGPGTYAEGAASWFEEAFDLRLEAFVTSAATGAGCFDPSAAAPAFAVGFLAGPAELPYDATSVTLMSQIASSNYIASVSAVGTSGPVAGTVTAPASFTVTVPVDASMTGVSVTVTDACGLSTTAIIPITFASVCTLPLYDICTDTQQGSVFTIDLRNAAGDLCLLTCTVPGPGQAASCDTSTITCGD